MNTVQDPAVITSLVDRLSSKINSDTTFSSKRYAFNILKNNTGGAKSPIRRHSLFFEYNEGNNRVKLIEVNIPLTYGKGSAAIQGRIIVDAKSNYYLARAVRRITTPTRIDITEDVKNALSNQIIVIDEKEYIIFCSINKYKTAQLIRVLSKIKICRKGIILSDIIHELEQIENDTSLTKTTKKQLVSCRLGQGIFRDRIIRQWKGTCPITKCNEIEILVASHIKPWKHSDNNERLDKFNGLLLAPTVDKLFDKGFISFADNGKILISELLGKKNISRLGLKKNHSIKLKEEHIKYMKFHRDNIYRN